MSSLRKQIRKEVVGLLKGRTDARDNVRANRGEVNWQENMPAINVYTRGENVEELDQAPRRMSRKLELEIEINAEGEDGEDISDKVDDLAEQVERCLSVDDSLGGCADDIVLTNVSDLDVDTGGSKANGSIKLTFEVRYNEYAPRDRKGQGRFEELQDINADWNMQPGQADADRAKDTITFP